TRLFLDDVEALVENALGRTALAAAHHAVDELGDERAVVQRIGRDVTLRNFSSSGHFESLIPNQSESQIPNPESLGFLGPLRPVLRASLHASRDADRVERAAHH